MDYLILIEYIYGNRILQRTVLNIKTQEHTGVIHQLIHIKTEIDKFNFFIIFHQLTCKILGTLTESKAGKQ